MNRIDLHQFDHESPSSVLIGENGGGKSTVLSELSSFYISQNRNVIAISHCIQDKFDAKSKSVSHLSAKYGENMYHNAIVEGIAKVKDETLSILGRSLIYCGFVDSIGIDFHWNIGKDGSDYTNDLKLNKFSSEEQRFIAATYERSTKERVRLPLNTDFPNYGIGYSIVKVLGLFTKLRECEVLKSITFYLSKKNERDIEFSRISSGEANQIATLFHIASNIKKDSVILIDEPENSLHPKWQREYIEHIFDVFHPINFNIIIATHSPLLINKTTSVYEVINFALKPILNFGNNIEEKMWTIFGVITPENEFLSRFITQLLNDYRSGRTSLISVNETLGRLKVSCKDQRQVNVINDVTRLLGEI